VIRVCDTTLVHLGHQARADGRWRIYTFADRAEPGEDSTLSEFAAWIAESADSPIVACTPTGADAGAWVDLNVVYQQPFQTIDFGQVPSAFLPRIGPLRLIDYENVYAAGTGSDGRGEDILRDIDRDGAIVIVRSDQYVASVLPLTATEALRAFFAPLPLPSSSPRCSRPSVGWCGTHPGWPMARLTWTTERHVICFGGSPGA
jgi:phenol 2-monooxygenase